MDKRPSGTVTFLFTDIEGSTKLSQQYPDKLPVALKKHHSALRKAIESNNGFVFEIIGDAFCSSFENAADAVKAAVDAQHNLADENWDEAVIKVRMGIHSGNAEWNGERYMGYLTLARTERVMSSAYGGQIIISGDSYDLFVKDSGTQRKTAKDSDYFEHTGLPGPVTGTEDNRSEKVSSDLSVFEVSFRDLGERRLKDLNQPVRLHQVIAGDLIKDFPPLKTLDSRPNNLPVQLTGFIGRKKEIAEIKNILDKNRLLTLLGPGGTGKTRLSLQIAADMIDDFENGVWIIELASLLDPDLISVMISDSLGIREEPGTQPETSLFKNFKNKKLLLIFDNCEHIIDACASIAEKIIQNFPGIKIIATSREALKCKGENIHLVLPLSHPDPKISYSPEQLIRFEAVRLFTERALLVNSNFRVTYENAPALAQICFQLDGIPLALELAAVRTKVLTVEKIFEKLNDRFRLLTGGARTALPRQQTLKALIDWSHDLLSESEKILLRRLSVFSGGWKLNDSEEICSDENLSSGNILDLMQGLIEKSLVLFDENKERYKMLETIRQYGNERLLESGEHKLIHNIHFNYYLELCRNALPELTGIKVKYWLDLFEEEYSNIQSALKWSLDENLTEECHRLAGSLSRFWEKRGYISEARSWLDKLLSKPEKVDENLRANSLRIAGIYATLQCEQTAAKKFVNESMEIYRKLDDKNGIAGCLNVLGNIEIDLARYESAEKCLTESLKIRKELGNKMGICTALNSLGLTSLATGDLKNAKTRFTESLEIAREEKDADYIGIGLNNLAQAYALDRDFDLSRKYFEEGMKMDIELGNKNGISISLSNMGELSIQSRDFTSAKKYFEEGLQISREIGHQLGILHSYAGLGQVYFGEEDYENAEINFMNCLSNQTDSPELSTAAAGLFGMAEIFRVRGDLMKAVYLAGVIEEKYKSSGAYYEEELKSGIERIYRECSMSFDEQKTLEEFNRGKKVTTNEAINELIKNHNA
ncbi:MAG: tetratricopeptide repeat protein [Bacteroidetes bacterium]|nr:tetratricopeptide repeat protein [Bacteroidota bacterium]